ncbi:MAG: hypothetical protein U1D36_13655 [Hydrogenophaga sp.]|uniref:hypothetical protein n=1 Tax=Hydrogenophaga sp. TaxID=1904254 RepID=UPI00272F9CF3|nr:hypothetical protein [Hydrogenophaga sp.]MDP2407111.1 hypothetical protein [Hydrogenophaga sp.]MDZ4175504.1 hypothetical protein [Hydrogenophaga sp.]
MKEFDVDLWVKVYAAALGLEETPKERDHGRFSFRLKTLLEKALTLLSQLSFHSFRAKSLQLLHVRDGASRKPEAPCQERKPAP